MAQVTLNAVLKGIDTLDRAELLQVRQAIEARLVATPSPEECFEQALLASGIVTHIVTPPTHNRERSLVPIQGKPLSETLCEERGSTPITNTQSGLLG